MPDINATLIQTTTLLERMNQDLKNMSSSIQSYVRGQSEATTSTARLTETLDDSEEALELEVDEMEKLGKATKEQLVQYKSLRKEIISYEKDLKRVERALKKQGLTAEARLSGERKREFLQKLIQNKSAGVAKTQGMMGGSVMNLIKRFNWLGFVITTLTGLFVGQYKMTKDIIQASAGFVEGTSLYEAQLRIVEKAMKLAIDPVEFQKMIVQNRQVVHALGGTEKAIEQATPAFEEFRRFGTSATDAMKQAIESMAQFRKLGIEATIHQQLKFVQDVAEMGKLFGMGADETRAYFNEIAEDADSIDLLKRARVDERAAILASQRAFIINARAAGMNTEQAKDAAKMLNKMVGAKPLDRLKQAARVRALAAAMGVSGGEQAAAAIRAGSKRSPEQFAQLADFSSRLATATDTMRGAGEGSEIFAEALLEKLDPEQMFGRASPFSLSLADTMKIDREEINKKMTDLLKDPLAAGVRVAEDTFTRMGIMAGSLMGLLKGVQGILDFLTGGWFSNMFDGSAGPTAGSAGDMAGEAAVESAVAAGTAAGVAVGVKAADKAKTISTTMSPEMERSIQHMKELEKFEASKKKVATEQKAQKDEGITIAKEQKAELTSARTGIEGQLKSMTSTNEILTRIHENSVKQIDLTEKQLVAMTLTDEEKKRDNYRRGLLEGNTYRFMGQE